VQMLPLRAATSFSVARAQCRFPVEASDSACAADKKLYQRRIQATDEEIDAPVYALYGLTGEEIAIVEGRDH
jgi:hypothetical protein